MLFTIAFASSTLLPGGSEAYLFTLRKSGFSNAALISVATLGNTLGAVLNYALGRWLSRYLHHKWFGFKQKYLQKAEILFKKYGSVSLLFSSLPVIGDPLTAVAGLLRFPFGCFFVLTALGKFIRYGALLWILRA